jgi:outer membrane lipoprotein carrier protein
LAVPVWAALVAPCLAEAPDTAAVLKKMEESGKRLTCLKADFHQQRIYALFDERKESSGTIFYKKPGAMLWKYNAPDRTAIYIRGQRVLMYIPDIKQVPAVSLAKDKKTEALLIGFGNTAEEITRNFDVATSAAPDGSSILDLTPKREEFAAHFTKLRLVIDPKSWLPVRSERFEPGGDRTVFTFSNIRTDLTLDDALFDFKPPEGTEVVEY